MPPKYSCNMNRILILMGSLCITSIFGAQTQIINIKFDDAPAAAPPPGWIATLTGKGAPKWTVERDATAPSQPHVLKQSGAATFPLCLAEGTSIKNGFVEVKFKAVSGKEDQAGGVIWRCKDADNYYIARANALEDNVEIYHTTAGKRRSFMEVSRKVTAGEWHTLRVDFQGSSFVVSFDGEAVIKAADTTFPDAGKVGLWTKADSVTLFDDFSFGGK